MFASELFHAFTPAGPHSVWDLLTISGTRADYLFGMTVESGWQPGSPVTMTAAGRWTLAGEVISAIPATGSATRSVIGPVNRPST